MFVQGTVRIQDIAEYLNSVVQDGWKIVSYMIHDDTKTLDVVHVVVEVKKPRTKKEN